MQYENWNEVQPNTLVNSVPDPSWINGDFSNLTYLNTGVSAPVTIYDPLTVTQNASAQYVRTPFPGNIIPASRINPVAQKILSYYPKPNVATPAGSAPFQNNYVVAGSDSNRYRNGLAKLDQNLSSKDRFSLHYGYWERVEDRSFVGFPNAADNGQLPHGERSHTFTTEEVHTVNPNLLLDLRANVTVRADYTFGGPRFDPTTLGLSPADVAAMGASAATEFPRITFSDNFASLGQNNTGQTVSNSLALFPSVTWIRNRHTIHAGLDARFQQSGKNLVSGGNNLSVDRLWTQRSVVASSGQTFDAASGNSIASFLLGNLTSGSNTINPKTYFSTHYWAPFVQDDWKVTKKLTLNLGVRWDFDPAQTERNNYGNYAFNTTAVNPVSSLVSIPGHSQLLGGLTFLGVAGAPRAQFALTKFNVQPRVGFAYAVNDKMVVRGGFGESFLGSSGNGAPTYGFSATTQYQASDPTRPTNIYPNLANPISHLYPSVVQPHGSSFGLLESLGQGPFSLNSNYKIPSFWTYSMGIEQQFGRRDTLNIEYVGTRLYNGNTNDNINHQDPAAFAPCNPDLGGRFEACTNNNPVNPFKGVNGFQGSNYYNQTTINALNFTRPFPEFGDMTEYQLNDGHTWYNSLQVTAAHKWNKSLTLHGTWTWAKQLDSGGFQDTTFRVAARHIDGNDRTHRVTLSGVYLLPVGRGRSFLGNANRIVDGAIGGWELGSLFIYQTGVPYNVPGQDNQIASPYVHPYINPANGYIRLVAPCVEQWKEDANGNYSLQQLTYFDTDYQCTGPNLKRVPNSNFGPNTNTVYTGVRVPSIYQFDTNLSKNFQLVERLVLQVRIEAFNVLNHPLWSAQPDTNFNDRSFGEITRGPSGQSNIPRQVQLSAKITW